jgi:hypothetical protein
LPHQQIIYTLFLFDFNYFKMFCLVGLGRSEERNVLDELLDTPEDDDLDVELCRTDKKLRSKRTSSVVKAVKAKECPKINSSVTIKQERKEVCISVLNYILELFNFYFICIRIRMQFRSRNIRNHRKIRL